TTCSEWIVTTTTWPSGSGGAAVTATFRTTPVRPASWTVVCPTITSCSLCGSSWKTCSRKVLGASDLVNHDLCSPRALHFLPLVHFFIYYAYDCCIRVALIAQLLTKAVYNVVS